MAAEKMPQSMKRRIASTHEVFNAPSFFCLTIVRGDAALRRRVLSRCLVLSLLFNSGTTFCRGSRALSDRSFSLRNNFAMKIVTKMAETSFHFDPLTSFLFLLLLHQSTPDQPLPHQVHRHPGLLRSPPRSTRPSRPSSITQAH